MIPFLGAVTHNIESSNGGVRIGKMQLLASGKVRLITVDGRVYEVRYDNPFMLFFFSFFFAVQSWCFRNASATCLWRLNCVEVFAAC